MELLGKLYRIDGKQQVSDKFAKREFVVEVADPTNPQYNQFVLIELQQDKCSLLDGLNVGDTVDVKINIRGRKHTNQSGEEKIYNTVVAWQVNRMAVGNSGHGAY